MGHGLQNKYGQSNCRGHEQRRSKRRKVEDIGKILNRSSHQRWQLDEGQAVALQCKPCSEKDRAAQRRVQHQAIDEAAPIEDGIEYGTRATI